MSRIITLQDLKQTELVDGNFYKQEVKKYEELCTQLAHELKQSKIRNFTNEDYIKLLEDEYESALKRLKDLNQNINVTTPSGGSEFIQTMTEYLTKDLGLNNQDIQKIRDENLKRLKKRRNLLYK